MKSCLLICLSVLFLNCEDKQTSQKKTTPQQSITTDIKDEKQKDTIENQKEQFPKLTSSNAMEFFLEYEKHNKENKVRIYTDFGNIDILLFNETKFHRANFIYLIKRNYFDNMQFYRVVKDFIIQGGSTDDPKAGRKRSVIGKYLLPPDTKRGFKHHRGVISMPSSEIENAYKLASPYEFFITQSNQYHLDGQYTIFGKVIAGLNVVDKIAAQEVDDSDWPLHNVYIKKVEIID